MKRLAVALRKNKSRLLRVFVAAFSVSAITPRAVASITSTDDSETYLESIAYQSEGFSAREANDLELLQVLQTKGLDEVTSAFEPMAERASISHVLASANLSKMLVLRYDFVLKDHSLQGRLIKLSDNRILLHTKNADHRDIALLFQGFQAAEINVVSLAVSRSRAYKPTASSRLLGLLVARAHASETAPSCVKASGSLDVIGGTVMHAGSKILNALASCGGAFQTAVSDSIDLNLKSFFTGGWATGITKTYSAMKSLVTEGSAAFIRGIGDSVKKIDYDVFIAVVCYAATTVAINAAFAAGMATASGGAALPILVLNTVKKIEAVAQWIKTLMNRRLVRNIRYLSKSLDGKVESGLLREGDMLTYLNKGGRPSGVLPKVKLAQKAESQLETALQKATCVADLEPGVPTRANAGQKLPAPAISNSIR